MKPSLGTFATPLLLILFLSGLIFSQERGRMVGSSVSGVVIDSASGKPVEYANVLLLNAEDRKLITGIATGSNGKFELTKVKPGKYLVEVQFIGFEKNRVENISIGRDIPKTDLGQIFIHPSSISLGDVVVEGERSPVSYQIDKKVIDVSQMQTAISGNAADVLQNVPSVTVDIEGNVSLRGSSNFTVLVEGRPSILDAQDVLQQIPATSIQTMEIITNPSAKYNPEGTAGIINIMLKKSEDFGLTGISHMNAGMNSTYGGDFLFEYKNDLFNSNFGVDYNKRSFPGSNRKNETYTLNGNTSTINSNGTSEWGGTGYGLRSGIEFHLGKNDVLNFGGRYGSRDFGRTSNLNYVERSQNSLLQYLNSSSRTWNGDFYGLNLNYDHKFGENGHDVKGEINYSNRNIDEITLTESFSGEAKQNGKRTSEIGPSKEVEGKIDYSLPLGAQSKFETGYHTEYDLSEEANGIAQFDSSSGAYIVSPQFTHNTRYATDEQAVYALYSDEWGNVGIQGGVRGEYTFRRVELADQNQFFSTDKWDFFPTLHASYKLQSGHQLMASYTRRIRRPGGGALEPFITWLDANNVQRGNPSLKNQYIDSYEAGAQNSIGSVSLSTEAYYRITHNKIERVRTAYSENVTLRSFENIGSDYSLGTELQLIVDPVKMWNVNLMGNLYQYRVEGMLYNAPFSRESFNWNTRLNNVIKFSIATQLQINASYNSPTVSSQGRREGFFTTDLALRQDLFERTFSLILQVRDLFGTAKQEFISQGAGYYSYNYSAREAPMVMLSIKYLFNNFSQEERREGNDNGGFNEGEGF